MLSSKSSKSPELKSLQWPGLKFPLPPGLFTAVEVLLLLFLSFNTLWNLIYLEKSFEWAFASIWLLIAVFAYSLARSWKGFKAVGIRLDNFLSSLMRGIIWRCSLPPAH